MKIKLKLPSKVKLGKNFIVRCTLKNPKTSKGTARYWFSIEPVNKKRFRRYWTMSSPGTAKASFEEVK